MTIKSLDVETHLPLIYVKEKVCSRHRSRENQENDQVTIHHNIHCRSPPMLPPLVVPFSGPPLLSPFSTSSSSSPFVIASPQLSQQPQLILRLPASELPISTQISEISTQISTNPWFLQLVFMSLHLYNYQFKHSIHYSFYHRILSLFRFSSFSACPLSIFRKHHPGYRILPLSHSSSSPFISSWLLPHNAVLRSQSHSRIHERKRQSFSLSSDSFHDAHRPSFLSSIHPVLISLDVLPSLTHSYLLLSIPFFSHHFFPRKSGTTGEYPWHLPLFKAFFSLPSSAFHCRVFALD